MINKYSKLLVKITIAFVSFSLFFIGCNNNTNYKDKQITSIKDEVEQKDNIELIRINMIDESNGFALAGKENEKHKVLRTDNGGVSWKNITPNIKDYYSIIGFYFLDLNRGWLAVSVTFPDKMKEEKRIYYTEDGGNNWESTLLNINGCWLEANFDFINPDYGWILLTSDAATGHMDKVVYRTKDGGKQWNQESKKSLPDFGFPTGFSFKDELNGWVTSMNHGEEPIGKYQFNCTKDGGATWNSQDLEIPKKYKNDNGYADIYPPVFNREKEIKDGIFLVHYKNKEKTIIIPYATEDGGKSWQSKTEVQIACAPKYDFIDSKTGWIISGIENKIYKTSDGGATWKEINANVNLKGAEIDFVNSKVGWALKDDKLLKTIDGGYTWIEISNYNSKF